jgi:hypothetical protein
MRVRRALDNAPFITWRYVHVIHTTAHGSACGE